MSTAPRRRRRSWPFLVAGFVVVLAVLGLVDGLRASDGPTATSRSAGSSAGSAAPVPGSESPESSTSGMAPRPDATAEDATARAQAGLAQLATFAVKGRAPKTGYSRAQFGQRWSDDVTVQFGHNGCDTRNDMLHGLADIVLKPGTRNCVVLSGTLRDPYTGRSIAFVRGPRTSEAVQIDHVVALSDAWQKGAQQLSADERRNFANDPRNLQPTDGSTNSRKRDGDAATWLPPNRAYRCTYVARQIEVKAAYRLWVTAAEKSAMTRLLTGCAAA
ncbi:HNH endonuclease family protein [Gordonia soli]|uniref:GmrSD restriction endonucleases C-terminal domain-containing protein n=1 Tax=Gordonia soli NBRC 108243 TaxID=1223545 RepID=M0QED4_9ACTN|nr:HNH endonuclease family protein [Gordonia soli]GAC66930.1 hypothetical protein GS4_05_01410 [Gordonia soli NBRC 108243]